MIPFLELERTGIGEVVYSWEDPDTGHVRLWAISRIEKWLTESGLKTLVTNVDENTAKWFYFNRGIERHRLEWLSKNPEMMTKPPIMLRMHRDATGEDWDLMLDGHHRYVTLALLGFPLIEFYQLTEEQASQFEVEGHPQPKNGLNINTFSGLGLDR